MTQPSASIEDYLGAIYRLHPGNDRPLPLSELQDHFGFSPISIHEMTQKMVQHGLVDYLPYKGVRLTVKGYGMAAALVRRHRVWECFLADALQVPIDEAHDLAGDLEHAAPDWITERLFTYLQQPEACPHGNAIGGEAAIPAGISIDQSEAGKAYLITQIFPENRESLQLARQTGLLPGESIRIIGRTGIETTIEVRNEQKSFVSEDLNCFWGMEITDGT